MVNRSKIAILSLWVLSALAACVPQSTEVNSVSINEEGIPLSVLKYNPKAASINAQLGIGYLQQGDVERAKTKLLIAEKQDPHSSEVASAMAYYYDTIGNAQEAERYYQQAYSWAKHKGDVANNYGVFLCRQKRYPEADRYFQKAIQDPNYVRTAQTYENMGLCHLLQNDKAGAKVYFSKAIRIDPQLQKSYPEEYYLATTRGVA